MAAATWYIELDEGTAADRASQVSADEPVRPGYIIRDYGREWIVDRADVDRLIAHAIPHD